MSVALRIVVAALLAMVVWIWPSEARAYPWMIRHEYTSCKTCHADPSGGGLLNAFGRAQGENLLRTRYGRPDATDTGKIGDFLFGAVELPESVLLGGDVRAAVLRNIPAGGTGTNRFILMQSDLEGQVALGRVRANASVGYVHEGAVGASLTRGLNDRLVSRVHWVGVDFGPGNKLLLRAGRMNLPFGVRSIEHTMWVHSEPRVDINAAQQHGVALAYNTSKIRTEGMVILGNFQVSPDKFRSRGFAGYFEYALTRRLALGASSMITHVDEDLSLQTPAWRHAHGVFARYSPAKPLVMTFELHYLNVSQPTPGTTARGVAGMFSTDFEPVQGVHVGPTLEILNRSFSTDRSSVGAWASAWWFFLPHADVRVDAIWQAIGGPADAAAGATSTGRTKVTTLLAQLHVYL